MTLGPWKCPDVLIADVAGVCCKEAPQRLAAKDGNLVKKSHYLHNSNMGWGLGLWFRDWYWTLRVAIVATLGFRAALAHPQERALPRAMPEVT